ncbi:MULTISPECIES: adenylosuccinate synthetase [Acidianus]|uniref:Adenylosuccinate synthetase n=1 Tax=Candidatus Acidianus copahuensis TaxID=1160895 RepID=A0A031LNF1_9CREN|nr:MULTISPECIES: adenylosuccinate synthetase [Acidianus]EZQ03069.1 adenylosuccinate synthetase [Candidatus Acidianus copahuensis]NON62918.1 adenylosuccinate synthetase [Acidianus sp. RZ1]
MLSLLVGGFYGDEGKGKIASYLAIRDSPEIIVRTGSINAGHTVVYNGEKWKIRIIPSGFLSKTTTLMLAPGSLTSLEEFFKEIKITDTENRIFIDRHVGIITQKEIQDERTDENLIKNVGSTGQGVGYAESRRVLRVLKLAKDYVELEKFLTDVPESVISALGKGKDVQVEGTQGTFLSLYHGEYPFVTSRNTTSSGILSEVGIGPKYVNEVIVVFKAFVTRVGNGYLEGELSPDEADKLGLVESGTVTGRRRRVAPFNIKLAKESVKINSATQVAITKIDSIFKDSYRVREYQKLPSEAKRWLDDVENELGVPITLIGTGEDTLDIIDLRNEKVGK